MTPASGLLLLYGMERETESKDKKWDEKKKKKKKKLVAPEMRSSGGEKWLGSKRATPAQAVTRSPLSDVASLFCEVY